MIAIDHRAVQGLVEALAPLSIGADGEMGTGETIIPFHASGKAADPRMWWGKSKGEWANNGESCRRTRGRGHLAGAHGARDRWAWSKLGLAVLSPD